MKGEGVELIPVSPPAAGPSAGRLCSLTFPGMGLRL